MKKKILLIEEELVQIKLLKLRFNSLGYELDYALDGESGFKKAKEIVPDVILLVVRMPKVDGFEACRRLKADPATKKVPVMIFTAVEDPELGAKSKACGADDIILKPYDSAELAEKVRKLLKEHKGKS